MFIEAVKIVYFSLTDPTAAQKRKRRYLTEIALHEVFLEAVPATLVLVVLLMIALGCSIEWCMISKLCYYYYAGSPSLGANSSPYTIILGEDYKGRIQSTKEMYGQFQ